MHARQDADAMDTSMQNGIVSKGKPPFLDAILWCSKTKASVGNDRLDKS